VPGFQKGLERVEEGKLPQVKPVPVPIVPEPVVPEGGR
jgi:hypothetical protein